MEPTKPLVGPSARDTAVPVGWARLQAEDNPTLSILVELGEAAPQVTQGYGGWDEIERRGRVSLTSWAGFKPVGIDLELSLDDFAAGKSVEPVIDVLEALAGRGRKATGGQPPVLIVDTAGVMPHDAHSDPDTRWVIQDLAWADDDSTIVNEHGNRVRANVTVSLLQHVSDDRLQDRALAARVKLQAQQKTSGAKRRYTVKTGDTLISIARRQLGDPGKWVQLAKLNGLRDPRAVKPGAQIRLP